MCVCIFSFARHIQRASSDHRTYAMGWQVNVVRGLKLYEDIFTGFELSKLNDFVNELRLAGRDRELSGGSRDIHDAFVVKLVFSCAARSYELSFVEGIIDIHCATASQQKFSASNICCYVRAPAPKFSGCKRFRIIYFLLISGDTYILYNQQVKGNKRELIQFGVPIFGQIKEDATDKFQKSMASLHSNASATYSLCNLLFTKKHSTMSKQATLSRFQLLSRM